MPTVKEVIRRSLKGVRGHIAVAIWQEEDVIERAAELGVQMSHKAAAHIIDEVDHHQDCSLGITWDTLEYHIEEFKRKHPHYRRCEELYKQLPESVCQDGTIAVERG